ncbi:SDR family NAD(P)-dependent oxidoreductase [Thermoflavimicrobium dichotomicum]|uniref:NAD(P)-dependent dehydrogenase, short-chain alcohol dehydrogenase family n=1 Tax=Thermoflavimicrobium dichotomicum TaxID=46223 RepID=A0A1I3T913_9BACL|nr:SDR family NAD(P)-dependent oxidoreductase [Thermoflavimicrobium dichotomicum]SFJ67063.1 NAD(P)-dependent dehydrogenase, short-chain alcohol dehydrogenase family [Thermoflavimicrobium dichotomicum]
MEFTNRVVLITGAAGVTGRMIAEKFWKENAFLALVDIDIEGLNDLAAELHLDDERALLIQADVRDEKQVEDYVRKTKEYFDKIDIFVNHAGIEGKVAKIPQLSVEDFDEVYRVNVRGVFLGLKYVIPIMQEQNYGVIINTSSIMGIHGAPCLTPYVMSKHAIIGMTKTAALECADYHIRVNSICPGPIESRMMQSIEAGIVPENPQIARDLFTQMIPFKHYGSAEDLAELVLFLASNRAKYITGSYFVLDGGLSIK